MLYIVEKFLGKADETSFYGKFAICFYGGLKPSIFENLPIVSPKK